MGETLRPVATGFNRSLSIETRSERLRCDPGAVLLLEVLDATGIVGWMAERMMDELMRWMPPPSASCMS
ncbi:hypothetical protein [Nioella ostreopsis]|jgi:hypothetical protein|uniref:hypothetical protein n=1 Tax=Nioella ostreopsis TaxID=2448479 RepID=UPI000FDC55C6|nr:hypothetical protein [Nioella ostreopsis]